MARRTVSRSTTGGFRFQKALSASKASGRHDRPGRGWLPLEQGCRPGRGIPRPAGSSPSRAGQEAAEALGEDLRLAVAQARLEPQDQARRLGSVVAQSLGRGDPDIFLRVDEPIDEDRQQTVHVDPCQREQRRGAERCGRVLATAPNRLQLHVAHGLQKNTRAPCSSLSRAWITASFARQSLSALSGSTRNRSRADASVGASSTKP